MKREALQERGRYSCYREDPLCRDGADMGKLGLLLACCFFQVDQPLNAATSLEELERNCFCLGVSRGTWLLSRQLATERHSQLTHSHLESIIYFVLTQPLERRLPAPMRNIGSSRRIMRIVSLLLFLVTTSGPPLVLLARPSDATHYRLLLHCSTPRWL